MQRVYRESLDLLERLCKVRMVDDIDAELVADFKVKLSKRRTRLKQPITASTVNKHLRTLRLVANRAGFHGRGARRAIYNMCRSAVGGCAACHWKRALMRGLQTPSQKQRREEENEDADGEHDLDDPDG